MTGRAFNATGTWLCVLALAVLALPGCPPPPQPASVTTGIGVEAAGSYEVFTLPVRHSERRDGEGLLAIHQRVLVEWLETHKDVKLVTVTSLDGGDEGPALLVVGYRDVTSADTRKP